jgi:YVTN family beta-propeller protein
MKRFRLVATTFIVILLGSIAAPAFAQLNENCIVAVLNRTVQVQPNGSWRVDNIPAGFGLVRARATCVQNGITRFGQSDLFQINANQVTGFNANIVLGSTTPIPASLTVTASPTMLTQPGQTVQLSVTATYADNSTKNLTAANTGTQYTVSNPNIASVNANGLVTAVSSGSVLIQAVNEGTQGITTIQVVLAGASHGGIADSWAIANGLDPTDPALPFEDPDHDGLTNLQEFQIGTDPNKADTDGDGLTDGQEVLLYHTNPLLFSTDGTGIPDGIEVQTGTLGLTLTQKLAKAISTFTVSPSSFVLNVNTIQLLAAQQLTVTAKLIDGKTTIDLTSTQKGTNYTSSDLTICNFGSPDGNVFAGANGNCTITITNSGFTTQATGVVRAFSPTPLSFLPIPGFANSVAVNGNYAFVAAGAAGLQVVNVSDRTHPFIAASLPLPGNANDVALLSNRAYVAAGSAGLHVVDISNPLAPARVGTLGTGGTALDVVVRGTTAYIANGTNLFLADVTNPGSMTPIATLPLAGTIQGLDVDTQRKLGVVAAGTTGIHVIDLSNPSAPAKLGTASTGDARDVAILGNFALVADYVNSTTSVDITIPSAPLVTSHILDPNLGGFLLDIALSGNFALAADVKFVNGIPITDISIPTSLRARAILNFPQRDDNGMGIAADGTFVYLTTDHNALSKFGSSGDGRLYIGQYLALVDDKGIPPTAAITSPATGATVIQGATLPITVNATDDVAVAAVNFLVNGQVVFTSTSAPYQFNFTVPTGISTLSLGATAVDLAGNIGNAQSVTLNVIPDPLTTVVGRVLDKTQNPVNGATVTTVGGKSSTSGIDGRFSITGVPTVLGSIIVHASATVNGASQSGTSASLPAVAAGTTNVGDIIVRSGGFIVVANSNSNTASVIDTSVATPVVVATLPTAGQPIGVSMTADGTTALVSDFSGFVTFVDLTTSPPSVRGTPLGIGTATESTAITGDGRFAVTVDGSNFTVNVSSIDIANKAIINTVRMPATAVAITPDNRTVIISDYNNNQFSILSLSSQGILTDTGRRIPGNGSGAGPIAIAPGGAFALVTNYFTDDVSVLRIDGTGNVTLGSTRIPVCCGSPTGIVITPDGTRAYVPLNGPGSVAVLSIDAAGNVTDTRTRITIPAGTPTTYFGVPGIAISADGRRAYISGFNSSTVSILDTSTNTVVGTIPVGSGPAGIGVPK